MRAHKTEEEKDKTNKALKQVAFLGKLMDNQFSIPGTNFRFGLDPIIGLLPGAGDLATFAISSYMLTIMAKNGASGYLLARMALNVLVDTAIGSIPFIGDVFDFAYKSNAKNVRLMQQHFQEGRHRGSAWKVIIPILLLVMLCMAGVVWGIWKLLAMLF